MLATSQYVLNCHALQRLCLPVVGPLKANYWSVVLPFLSSDSETVAVTLRWTTKTKVFLKPYNKNEAKNNY